MSGSRARHQILVAGFSYAFESPLCGEAASDVQSAHARRTAEIAKSNLGDLAQRLFKNFVVPDDAVDDVNSTSTSRFVTWVYQAHQPFHDDLVSEDDGEMHARRAT